MSATNYTTTPNRETDVLAGKAFGRLPGNQNFQAKVRVELERYVAATRAGNKEEKVKIVNKVINRAKADGVRFLRRALSEEYHLFGIPGTIKEAWVHMDDTKLVAKVQRDLKHRKEEKRWKEVLRQSSADNDHLDDDDVVGDDDEGDGKENDGGVNVDGNVAADAVLNNGNEIMGIVGDGVAHGRQRLKLQDHDNDEELDFSEEELVKMAVFLPARAAALARRRANLLLGFLGCAPYYDSKGRVDLTSHQFDAGIFNPAKMPVVEWKDVVARFPWGCELASGGYKKVYKVFDITTGSYGVVAIMVGFQRIRENKPELDKLAAELAASAMVSSLVQRDICPNFIVVKPSFACNNVPSSQWHSLSTEFAPKHASNAITTAPPGAETETVFIHSEHCDQGDLEMFVQKQEYRIIPKKQAQMFFFQVTVALYAGQIHCFLKHYDLKLSNVLLHLIPRPKDETRVVLRYVIRAHTFALKMEPMEALVAKLADFGSSNVFPSAAGRPISWRELGTVVYTPPEVMFLGNAAKQGHSFDIFNLGLCMFHLYSGHSYWELLADVECPDILKARLQQVWEEPEYSLTKGWSEMGPLYDTFYRYMVLFDIPRVVPRGGERVWQATRQAIACSSTFHADRKAFSLTNGNNEYFAILQERLGNDGMQLMQALLSWDPDDRPNYYDVLECDFMKELRETCKDYGPSQLVKTYTIEE